MAKEKTIRKVMFLQTDWERIESVAKIRGMSAQDLIRLEIMNAVSDAESDAIDAPIGGEGRTLWKFNFTRVEPERYAANSTTSIGCVRHVVT